MVIINISVTSNTPSNYANIAKAMVTYIRKVDEQKNEKETTDRDDAKKLA